MASPTSGQRHLDARQLQAVALLAAGKSRSEVESRLPVSRSTLTRWVQLTEFQAAVRELQQDAFEAALAELKGLAQDCVRALRVELRGGDNSAAVALKLLSMLGAERLLEPRAKDTEPSGSDRIAGLGRPALLEREIARLRIEQARMTGDTTDGPDELV